MLVASTSRGNVGIWHVALKHRNDGLLKERSYFFITSVHLSSSYLIIHLISFELSVL